WRTRTTTPSTQRTRCWMTARTHWRSSWNGWLREPTSPSGPPRRPASNNERLARVDAVPDAHQHEADSKDDEQRDSEREDGAGPVDAGAFVLGGGRDSVLAGHAADGIHNL